MDRRKKATIYVHGKNVGEEYNQAEKVFSVVGLLRCAVYFKKRDFTTKLVLHRNYKTLASSKRLKDGDELLKLESANAGICVVFTPAGCDEKEYLIQTALDHGGIILSNEKFEDEKAKREDWTHFLNHRCLPFQFTNFEFTPMPPTVNGHVTDIDSLLYSSYGMESDVDSASALTSYLLNSKLDESNESAVSAVSVMTTRSVVSKKSHAFGGIGAAVGHMNGESSRRVRDNNGTPQKAHRRYIVGQIVKVGLDSATIEFEINKDTTSSTVQAVFNRDAYRPNGRVVRDLTREFRIGDCIGFISAKTTAERAWKVEEVRKKGEMKRGYGRYRALAGASSAGIIEARYKADSGGGDVFFPGAAFRDEGILLANLHRGHWLYYYAFDQKPSAGCTAVAVEVFSATTSGVIVKKTSRHVLVWSPKTEIARGDAVRFPEGAWVKFQFQQRTVQGRVQWIASEFEPMSPPSGITVETDNVDNKDVVVNIRCPAVTGIVTPTHGTIWTEAFGLLPLSPSALKQLYQSEPDGVAPYQPFRIWAVYQNEHCEEPVADEESGDEGAAAASQHQQRMAWRVISMVMSTSSNASGAEFSLPPSITFDVDATVLEADDGTDGDGGGRGPHWICKSEKFGRIFVTPNNFAVPPKQLNVGDRVKLAIVPQPLVYGDEHRAFVAEKIHSVPPPLLA